MAATHCITAALPSKTAMLTTGASVLLLWSLAASLPPAVLGQDFCRSAEKAFGRGQQRTFSQEDAGMTFEIFVPVKRDGSSFEGISITVPEIEDTVFTDLFSAEEQCFPDDKWHKVRVFVQIKPKESVTELALQVLSCKWTCVKAGAPASLQKLSVVLHGPSGWIGYFPTNGMNCPLEELTDTTQSLKLATCDKPDPVPAAAAATAITLPLLAATAALAVAGFQ